MIHIFPELTWDRSLFQASMKTGLLKNFICIHLLLESGIAKQREHNAHQQKQREFFDEVARHRYFDPLIAHHWYSVTYAQLDKYKVPVLSIYLFIYVK